MDVFFCSYTFDLIHESFVSFVVEFDVLLMLLFCVIVIWFKIHQRSAKRLLHLFKKQGGIYVKVIQQTCFLDHILSFHSDPNTFNNSLLIQFPLCRQVNTCQVFTTSSPLNIAIHCVNFIIKLILFSTLHWYKPIDLFFCWNRLCFKALLSLNVPFRKNLENIPTKCTPSFRYTMKCNIMHYGQLLLFWIDVIVTRFDYFERTPVAAASLAQGKLSSLFLFHSFCFSLSLSSTFWIYAISKHTQSHYTIVCWFDFILFSSLRA